jgi:transcriptional regulator with XRE-family HTH domain
MPPDRETVARNLREARENLGVSQHAVAKKLRVSRTLIAQIELGNRPVTDEELARFASLYGRTPLELKGPDWQAFVNEDPVTAAVVKIAPELAADNMQTRIHAVLGWLLEALQLERVLERPSRIGPPAYSVVPPRTASDAIAQGEQIADQERQRLGIRHAPIADLPRLLADQGVRVFATELPERMSAMFLQHASVGSAVVINATDDAARRRFFIAHGYAHALFDRTATARVCKDANSKELIERRAHAFAAAFLLPAFGVEEPVRSLGKGGSSRNVQWVFDGATDHAVRTEQRSAPGSQTITYVDVASIANRFGAGYRLTVSRLLGLGLISESDSERLLKRNFVELANRWLAIFGRVMADVLPSSSDTQIVKLSNRVIDLSDLGADRLHLFIEAFRRELIDQSGLPMELSALVPGLSEDLLLEFVRAAR